jgi:signal transduction histidine kinase/CheY-like chemotaxis protein
MSIGIDHIRAERHPEIGKLLQRDAILLAERWCERATEEIPDARHVHRAALRNQLPRFVAAMAQAFLEASDQSTASCCAPANEHGQQRWNNKWSLAALVRDYQLLQLVILEHLEESLKRRLEYREVMSVSVHIEDAIAASITAYVASRDEDVRRLDRERFQALQQADRRKDEFIAILAHELRNSLAPIVTSIDLLQLMLKEADPTVTETVHVIGRHAKQVTCLVDDLLDLARIAQGQFELRKKHVDLATILEQAIQTSCPFFESRRHRLHIQLPKEMVYVHADPARLVQILVNLLNNAAKYTKPGGEAWLTTERIDDEIVIKIRDTGVGIPPEMISHVFDMFVQVDKSFGKTVGGLGIGLTLVQKLTELHGGSVTCHSLGIGHGSEFVVRLKASDEPGKNEPSETPLESDSAVSCNLVIIEDQPDARNSLAALLKMIGHDVHVAENATTGIECCLQYKPRVALIDIGLPDSNGYEVARQLRTVFDNRVFLVALTGYGQEGDLRAALDAGFDAHLVKPADIGELTRLLSRVAADPRRES